MKILHIWDQAGVACVLAKHQRNLGHDVKIMKRAGYDPFGIFEYYGESLLEVDGKSFLNAAIKAASAYDIVHVHSLYKIIPDLRRKYPDKKLVLHYHGSEVRRSLKDPIQQQAETDCNQILGSTEDLGNYTGKNMIYVPNPIDTELFMPSELTQSSEGKAFTFETTGADIPWVIQYLKDNKIDIQIEVLDRQAHPIRYSQMPSIFTRYAVYVDLKFIGNMLLQAMSKTGLESLACGLRVLDYRLQYVNQLPSEHRPERVASQVLAIYQRT